MEKTGLTLGKFAPFHKGHEYIISTALNEMDHVIVVLYNASLVTEIPESIRAGWIKTIFPSVEIIIAEDGPQETGYTREIIEMQNNFLIKLLRGRKINSFYSSENYGKHVADALNCNNRIVDLKRNSYSINGTKLRDNPVKYKEFVSKCVFDEIKPKYYFIGAPSTGKTTISKYCAEYLNGAYCEEYGREYWFKNQREHRLTMLDLEIIAEEHTKSENEIFKYEYNLTFIDTCVITTYAYALYYYNEASEKLKNILKKSLYKYKNVFLCDEDIPFDDSWDRSGPNSRKVIQNINKDLMKKFNLNFILLSGALENRFKTVNNYISKENEHFQY